jgi:hypothetical protein
MTDKIRKQLEGWAEAVGRRFAQERDAQRAQLDAMARDVVALRAEIVELRAELADLRRERSLRMVA